MVRTIFKATRTGAAGAPCPSGRWRLSVGAALLLLRPVVGPRNLFLSRVGGSQALGIVPSLRHFGSSVWPKAIARIQGSRKAAARHRPKMATVTR